MVSARERKLIDVSQLVGVAGVLTALVDEERAAVLGKVDIGEVGREFVAARVALASRSTAQLQTLAAAMLSLAEANRQSARHMRG